MDGLADDHFGSHGGGGNGGATAEGLELDVYQNVVFDLQIDLHDVAALGVADFTDAVGVFNGTHIPGVYKVIYYFFAI